MLGPKGQDGGKRRAEIGREECPGGRDHCILAAGDVDYAAKHARLADSCELNCTDCQSTMSWQSQKTSNRMGGEGERRRARGIERMNMKSYEDEDGLLASLTDKQKAQAY